MTVDVVSVHFHPSHLSASLAIGAEVRDATEARRWVAVLNNPELDSEVVRAAGGEPITHDNSGLEFGAWQTGLESLEPNADCVVFLNDSAGVHRAFPRLHRNNLSNFCRLSSTTDLPAWAGEEERSARAWRIRGKHTNRWMTTSAFAINRAGLEVLAGQLYYRDLEDLISTRSVEEFFDPGLDRYLVEHISQWLFRPESGIRWYGAAPLTADNIVRMASKTRSILQEKHLAAALDDAGAAFHDIKAAPGLGDKIKRRLERDLFEWLRRRAARR